jgi:hypothetical protein
MNKRKYRDEDDIDEELALEELFDETDEWEDW